MKKKQKQKRWIRLRHRVITNIARWIFRPLSCFKYNIKIDRFKQQGDRQYLILFNHQTPYDQFFVGIAFKGPIYYLATEDIFSNGLISSLLRWAVAPIPIKKQTTDVSAVINCLRVVKEGGTIAIAPEGNRTYSGKTEYMSPAIAGLARKLGLPIALYRIEGGYGSEPRWSDKVRKGKMHSYVAKVIEPEEYAELSNDELLQLIENGLYVNEGVADGIFKSNKRAEYLERAIYVCPYCGLSKHYSEGNIAQCETCGRKINYGYDKRIKGIGFNFPFEFMTEWYEYQKSFVSSLDVLDYTKIPMFCDKASVREVIVYKKKVKLSKEAEIKLYGNRIVLDEGKPSELVFDFNSTSAVSVLGRNKLNIYYKSKIYQLKGDKHFSALKYVNIYYRYKSIVKGEKNGEFLGL